MQFLVLVDVCDRSMSIGQREDTPIAIEGRANFVGLTVDVQKYLLV